MKTSKIIRGLLILMMLTAINNLAINVSAQETEREGKKHEKCAVDSKNIYFVDSGTVISTMHPGSNGGNGYQLNILGVNVDKYEVVQEPYMTSVGVIPNYTNAASAKWELVFNPNMGRVIRSVRMTNTCTGVTKDYRLDAPVKLLDQ